MAIGEKEDTFRFQNGSIQLRQDDQTGEWVFLLTIGHVTHALTVDDAFLYGTFLRDAAMMRRHMERVA